MTRINDKHKDRLFCYIFGREENKKWTLELFNAMNNSQIADPNDIQIFTIENFLYMGMHNDVAFIIQDTLDSYEQQSTFNPNMPIRQLIYIAKLYEKFINTNKYNIYSRSQVYLPKPKLAVFYNGKENIPDMTLHLSDAFKNIDDGVEPDITVDVRMVNINYANNKEILDKCKPLKEYSWLIDRIRYHCIYNDVLDAVNLALDKMNSDFLIKPFLMSNKSEVMNMLFTEYNEEEVLAAIGKEYFEEGHEKGFAEGIEQGIEQGVEQGRTNNISKIKELAEQGLISEDVKELLMSKVFSD